MGTLFGIIVAALAVHQLIVDDKPRKSPAAYRREKQFYKAEQALRRYESLPPMVRVIDQERRWKRARRAAVGAVTWALFGGEWSNDEINGAVVKALYKDKALVFDHYKLHATCLKILQRATNCA